MIEENSVFRNNSHTSPCDATIMSIFAMYLYTYTQGSLFSVMEKPFKVGGGGDDQFTENNQLFEN